LCSSIAGGDNSNGAIGNFYEGLKAKGVTTAVTDASIKANIVGVGHKM
jgi:non-reducing end alpha-L-arabinofuranosidase